MGEVRIDSCRISYDQGHQLSSMHCENLNIVVVHQEKNGAVRKALCNKCPKVIFLFGPKGGGEWLKWRCRARISGCPFGESASLLLVVRLCPAGRKF